ncbi:MAG: hypothetical protein H0X15_06605 [Acidobacteria bacterium]|nr:hypothetical protein [Acidobacteriota bacterium]
MQSKVVTGIIAALIGGVAFGMIMTMMSAPDGKPMMAMVAKVVQSDSLVVGWLYHLFNSVIIGASFGLLFGNRVQNYGAGILWGIIWGVVWWIIGGLILMPLFLGMPVFAPLTMEPMRMMGIMSLMGHIIFGAIMGLAFFALVGKVPAMMEAN